jgi:hypothetical protein
MKELGAAEEISEKRKANKLNPKARKAKGLKLKSLNSISLRLKSVWPKPLRERA